MALQIPEQFGSIEITLDPKKSVPSLGLHKIMDGFALEDPFAGEREAGREMPAGDPELTNCRQQIHFVIVNAVGRALALSEPGQWPAQFVSMDGNEVTLAVSSDNFFEMEERSSFAASSTPGEVEMEAMNDKVLFQAWLNKFVERGHEVKFAA